MPDKGGVREEPRSRFRRLFRIVHRTWITLGSVAFAVFTVWMVIAYRASGDAIRAMVSDERVIVIEAESHWSFTPRAGRTGAALLFFPGALVDPVAYAPLLRRVAEHGHPVVLVRVPRRGAFGGADGPVAIERAHAAMRNVDATGWVVAGHSRGAEITVRALLRDAAAFRGAVLIGSSHPRDASLAHLRMPIARVYGTRDTVADVEKLEATRHNLPAHTRWVRIDGGNHSQFGYYGFQPGDWPATISRDAQQAITLTELLSALASAG